MLSEIVLDCPVGPKLNHKYPPRHKERTCENGSRDCSDAATSQGTHSPQKLEGEEALPLEYSECSPSDTLTLDFWPPELGKNKLGYFGETEALCLQSKWSNS
jgi:hypothetical protein